MLQVTSNAFSSGLLRAAVIPASVAASRHAIQAVRWKTVRHQRWTDKKSGDKLRTQLQKVLGAHEAGTSGKKQAANAMFAIMKDATHSMRPDFAEAFRTCGQWRDLSTLDLLLRMAKSRAVELNTKEYAEYISACARVAAGYDGHGVDERHRRRALEAGRSAWLQSVELGIRPEIEQMRAILQLCAKAGDSDWAQDTWMEMEELEMTPDAESLQFFVEAMAHDAGWDVVEAELAGVDKKRAAADKRFDQQMLMSLLNAAGVQRQLEKVEWVWKTVVPLVQVSATAYCERARALLLCDNAQAVAGLRAEMEEQGIAPIFRNFLFEAQALLMLLDEKSKDSSDALFEGLRRTLGLAQQQRTYSPQAVPREDVSMFQDLQALVDKIAAGETVDRDALRVIV
eukprot:TRINITY_DN40851_c0_g1_i1.p1 TRINITY_DN40851_c0_g1~~TRINITY_DN40851_c0_g1_i1.p1  ORF type:complete len:398 (+),score=108.30 TRINITY_DN40851_c0_g1_i1:240-1433(+)